MARAVLRGDRNISDEEAARAVASYVRSWLPVDERDRAEQIGAEDARKYPEKPKKMMGPARRRVLAEQIRKELGDDERAQNADL